MQGFQVKNVSRASPSPDFSFQVTLATWSDTLQVLPPMTEARQYTCAGMIGPAHYHTLRRHYRTTLSPGKEILR